MIAEDNHSGGCQCPACIGTGSQQAITTTEGSAAYVAPQATDPYYISALKSGYVWANDGTGITLTYKFWTSLPSYYVGQQEATNFQQFTTAMKDATRDVLGQLSTFCNITFTETTDTNAATMGFAQAQLDPGAGAWAYYPGNYSQAGDVWTNNLYAASTQNVAKGTYGFMVLLHEIGHALGLKHSFQGGTVLTGAEDTSRFTVMSYTWPFYPESYMLYDIAALQNLYGANMNHATGNNNYVLKSGAVYTIWDAGGTDTLDGSALSTGLTLNMNAGGYSSVGQTQNIAIAYNVTIENANGGSGNDTITDNSANNTINCGAGNDTVNCGAGNDTIDGGLGSDTVVYAYALVNYTISIISATSLSLTYAAQTGTDVISNVENFTFSGQSYTFNQLEAVANPSNPVIGMELRWGLVTYTHNSSAEGVRTFTAGNIGYTGATGDVVTVDRTDATTMVVTINNLRAPADMRFAATDDGINITVNGTHAYMKTMFTGGNGDDTYAVGATVVGNDRVYGDDGEDTISTGGGNDLIYGDAGADTIDGGAGVDVIYGGTENDTIYGGLGNDRLWGDAGDDVVSGGNDSDLIYGGIGNDTLNGDGGNDIIYGGADNDIIEAGSGLDRIYGEAGADTINGGEGSDAIYAGTENDTVSGDGGNDLIYGGAGNDVLNGGLGNDRIWGDDGHDTLDGQGGLDALYGKLGNDTFKVTVIDGSVDIFGDFRLLGVDADKIDVSDVLSGYDVMTDNLTDFVRFQVNTTTNATLQINQDGLGVDWVSVAVVLTSNFTGVSVDVLETNGQLITV